MKTSLKLAAEQLHATATERGWHENRGQITDEEFIKTSLLNIHGEVSEAWEAYREARIFSPCDKAEKMAAAGISPLTCIEEELADIVIRVFDTAERIGIDIGKCIELKNEFNKTRPHRHGGKIA